MRILSICLVAALACLSGCRKPEIGEYGNFAKAQSVELAADAAEILTANYPPAKTRLNLMQDTDDAFGAALLDRLRGGGYAVAEYVQSIRRDKYMESPVKRDGFDFAYVVDYVTEESALRVSLFVGEERMSRLYRVGGTPEEPRYSPMGEWARWR